MPNEIHKAEYYTDKEVNTLIRSLNQEFLLLGVITEDLQDWFLQELEAVFERGGYLVEDCSPHFAVLTHLLEVLRSKPARAEVNRYEALATWVHPKKDYQETLYLDEGKGYRLYSRLEGANQFPVWLLKPEDVLHWASYRLWNAGGDGFTCNSPYMNGLMAFIEEHGSEEKPDFMEGKEDNPEEG